MFTTILLSSLALASFNDAPAAPKAEVVNITSYARRPSKCNPGPTGPTLPAKKVKKAAK